MSGNPVNAMSVLMSDTPTQRTCNCGRIITSYKLPNGKFSTILPPWCHACMQTIEHNRQQEEQKVIQKRAEIVRNNISSIAIKSGMPSVFANINKRQFTQLSVEFAKEILRDLQSNNYERRSFILYGDSGTGKSYFAAYLFCCYIYLNPYLDYNKNTISWMSLLDAITILRNSDFSHYKYLKPLCYDPILSVIEFGDTGKEGVLHGGAQSNFVANLLQTISDSRWKNKNSKTIWILKTPSATKDIYRYLIKRYDQATVGRILDNSQPIKFSGGNQRMINFYKRSIWEL